MIIGEVTPNKEAVVQLTVQDGQGQLQEVRAVIDTGFTEHLSLPAHLVDVWGLPFLQPVKVILADGSRHTVPVYTLRVHWSNQVLTIPVFATGGTPLLGMALLYGNSLTMQIIDGGAVTIEAI